jgi:hypothetical protein
MNGNTSDNLSDYEAKIREYQKEWDELDQKMIGDPDEIAKYVNWSKRKNALACRDECDTKIMMLLADCGRAGARLKDIWPRIGLTKANTKKHHLDKLVKEGKVLHPELGGKYYINYNKLDSVIYGYLFGKRALLNLFVKNNRRVFYSEQMLLECSNGIGAFITFCILQTLNPSNKMIIPTTTKYPMARNQAAEQWLNNCVSHIAIFLLIKYRDAICTVVSASNSSNKRQLQQKQQQQQLRFMLDQNVIDKMLKSFREIYPEIHKQLTREFAALTAKVAST